MKYLSEIISPTGGDSAICRAKTPHVSQLPKKSVTVTSEYLKHHYYIIELFILHQSFNRKQFRFGVYKRSTHQFI